MHCGDIDGSRREWRNVCGYQSALSTLLFPNRITVAGRVADFHATTTVRQLGCISMINAHANAAFEMQTLIPRRHHDDFLVLALQLTGQTVWRHASGGIHCGPETLAFMNRQSVVHTEQLCAAGALVVKIPRTLARRHRTRIEDLCWSTAIGSSGSAKIVRDFVLDLWNCSAELRGRDFELLPLTLLTLIECAFQGCDAARQSSQPEQEYILYRLREEIAARQHEGPLNADQLARSIGVSRSKLYRITGEAGTSVEKLVIDTRLDWIAKALTDPTLADIPITDLAFEAGFSSLAHFSRRFKARFARTPREYRAAQLA